MVKSLAPELGELLHRLYCALPDAHYHAAQAVPGPTTARTAGSFAFHLEMEAKVTKIRGRIKETSTAEEPGEWAKAGGPAPVTGHVVGMVKSVSPERAEELRQLYAQLPLAHSRAKR